MTAAREPEAAPTPRPWRVVVDRDMGEILIEGPETALGEGGYPHVVHQVLIDSWDGEAIVAWKIANANLIVEAVNADAGLQGRGSSP